MFGSSQIDLTSNLFSYFDNYFSNQNKICIDLNNQNDYYTIYNVKIYGKCEITRKFRKCTIAYKLLVISRCIKIQLESDTVNVIAIVIVCSAVLHIFIKIVFDVLIVIVFMLVNSILSNLYVCVCVRVDQRKKRKKKNFFSNLCQCTTT